jgi:phenylacetate-CoA ligase
MQWTRILKRRGSLPRIRASVATILLLGEVCLPGQRHKLALDWAADVFDASYGSTETGTIAATCERGGLHLLLTGHIVELRHGESIAPPAPGMAGELIDTTLNNFARPLLRYATGDMADVHAAPCPCGVPLPTVRVHGRQSDGVALRGIPLTEHLVGSLVYDDPRLTGYLVQLHKDGTGGRLLLEKDVDVADGEGDLVASARKRFAQAGIDWDEIAIVSQLPATSKSGGSQKNWKRTNVVIK